MLLCGASRDLYGSMFISNKFCQDLSSSDVVGTEPLQLCWQHEFQSRGHFGVCTKAEITLEILTHQFGSFDIGFIIFMYIPEPLQCSARQISLMADSSLPDENLEHITCATSQVKPPRWYWLCWDIYYIHYCSTHFQQSRTYSFILQYSNKRQSEIGIDV